MHDVSPRLAMICLALVCMAGDTAVRGREGGLPTAEEVIGRYIEAVGGRDALEKLATRACAGHEVDDRPYRGAVRTTPFEMYAAVPGKWVAVWLDQGGTLHEGFDGRVGWRASPQGTVQDDEQGRRKLAWLLDPHGPLRVGEYFPGLRVQALRVVGERQVYEVTGDRDDAHFALYFDVATGLLVRIGYYWDISDYRPVDGVLVPFRVARSRKGGSTTWVFEEVRHNVSIAPERFSMPG